MSKKVSVHRVITARLKWRPRRQAWNVPPAMHRLTYLVGEAPLRAPAVLPRGALHQRTLPHGCMCP